MLHKCYDMPIALILTNVMNSHIFTRNMRASNDKWKTISLFPFCFILCNYFLPVSSGRIFRRKHRNKRKTIKQIFDNWAQEAKEYFNIFALREQNFNSSNHLHPGIYDEFISKHYSECTTFLFVRTKFDCISVVLF